MRLVLISLAACVVLALAAYLLAVRPLSAQRIALEQETAELQTQEQQLRGQLAQLEMIQGDELGIRAALNRQQGLIPVGDPAQPSFVRQVQIAADDAGVEILSLVFGRPAPVADAVPTGEQNLVLSQIPLTANVSGGYFQAVDLFRRIEVQVERGIAIDSVSFLESEDGFPRLNVAVNARLFAQIPSVAPIAPEPVPSETPSEAAQ